LGFLTKQNSESHCQGEQGTRATAWVLNESTYEKKYGAHTQSNKATTTYHHIALIGKGITTAYTDFGGHLFLLMGSSCAAGTIFGFL
jgi:hypothetical protein